MGVPGLWELLRPASTRASLSSLSKSAYQTNRHGLRALTIGIDASLWLFHAQVPTAGENPLLRTLWFKICTLLQQPVLPVFVFDGPNKPSSKRGNKVGRGFGTTDRSSVLFKALLNECGLEWWNAPGEAEAELAVMNRQGKIDAVLTDDVDTLLFGATCIVRNNSATLSGTKSAAHVVKAKDDVRTYEIYRSSDIADVWTAKENTALTNEEDCRMAMVLVALLAGGDYVPEGLGTIGEKTAFALAHAGFANQLSLFISDPRRFTSSIPDIKLRMIDELLTNGTGHIGRKNPAKANALTKIPPSDLFPQSSLQSYLHPATSPLSDLTAGWPGFGLGAMSSTRGKARNCGRGDMEGMAKACEKYFEWGTKELVSKKFAGESTGVFGADILVAARNRRLEMDKQGTSSTNGAARSSVQSRMTSFFGASATGSSATLSKPANPTGRSPSPGTTSTVPSYVLYIKGIREDPTCRILTEYRIVYKTQNLIERVHSAMIGHRVDPKDLSPEERAQLGLVSMTADNDDEDGPSASQAKGEVPVKGEGRVWMAEWLVKDVWPSLVEAWEEKQAAKNTKVVGKGRTKSTGKTTPKKAKAKAVPAAAKGKSKAPAAEDVGTRDFFGSTQAQAIPAPVDVPTSSQFSQPEAGPSTQPAKKGGRSKSPTRRSASRSATAASRPRAGAGEVITISDSEDETVAPLDPKRKALVLSSTPTPPRRTTSRTTKDKDATSREDAPLAVPSRLRTISRSPNPAAGTSRLRLNTARADSTGSQVQPILINSSDEEEEPRARTVSPPDSLDRLITRRARRSVLSPSTRQNTSSPTLQPASPTLSKSKLIAKKATTKANPARPPAQLSLGMPAVALSTRSNDSLAKDTPPPATPTSTTSPALPSLSPSKSRTAARSSPSPLPEPTDNKKGRTKPRRSYEVLVDGGEEGGGVIDCTRGGRLLKDTRRR